MSKKLVLAADDHEKVNLGNDTISLRDLLLDNAIYSAGVRVIFRIEDPGRDETIKLRGHRRDVALLDQVDGKASTQEQLYAVVQIQEDTSFSVDSCEFYFNPDNDDLVLLNNGDKVIEITSIAEPPSTVSLAPRSSHFLSASRCWKLQLVGGTVVQIRILQRQAITSVSTRDEQQRSKRPISGSWKTGTSPILKKRELTRTDQTGLEQYPIPIRELSTHVSALSLKDNEAVQIPAVVDAPAYRVERTRSIASTTASEVYLAQHSQFSKSVAVKIFKTSTQNASDIIKRASFWSYEITIHKSVRHTAIVKFLGADARFLAIFLEYVDGHSLASREYLTPEYRCSLGSDVAMRVWRDIAAALRYLHSNDIIHHDIKPANILYSKERGAVLCDFGLARQGEARGGGTPWYLPTEFLTERKPCSSSADIWALGITMLYTLGYISLPEKTPRHQAWLISDVNYSGGKPTESYKAMRDWLIFVETNVKKLPDAEPTTALLRDMFHKQPDERMSAAQLVQQLNMITEFDEITEEDTQTSESYSIEPSPPSNSVSGAEERDAGPI